jgi:large subunit ribosomal protein L30e
MVDIEKTLKNTIKNGKVKIGTKQTTKSLKEGNAKLIVISKNNPYTSEITDLAKKKKIPIFNYNSNSIDLGYSCGKSFAVSVFAVIDDGGSNIINLVKKG